VFRTSNFLFVEEDSTRKIFYLWEKKDWCYFRKALNHLFKKNKAKHETYFLSAHITLPKRKGCVWGLSFPQVAINDGGRGNLVRGCSTSQEQR